MKIEDVIRIMESINYEIYELTEDEFSYLSLTTNGEEMSIEFLDITIWSTIEDYRKYNDDSDDYEPLLPFLKREIMKLVKNITKINFKEGETNEQGQA